MSDVAGEPGAPGGLPVPDPNTAAPVLPAPAGAAPTQPAAPAGEPAYRRPSVGDLPPETLKLRLEAERKKAADETRKAVYAELGIEDPAKFKTTLTEREQELKKLKDAEAKRQREAMSEQQRTKADLEAAQAEAKLYREQLEQYKDQEVTREQAGKLESIASKHVATDFLDAVVSYKFKEHVRALMKTDPKALAAMDDRAVDKWFREFVRANPAYARKEGEKLPDPAPKPPEKKIEIKRIPITTGKPPAAPSATAPKQAGVGNPALAGKTPRPGRPNSMTAAEVAAYAASNGVKYPR